MSEALSAIYPATAPRLSGAWLFDPRDPDGTEANFPFASGRSEQIGLSGTSFRPIGREYPITEFGVALENAVIFTVTVPFDDDYKTGVAWWNRAILSRSVLCYRDNRERLVFGVIVQGATLNDDRVGTSINIRIDRNDYDESI